jgi:hypothetical protein
MIIMKISKYVRNYIEKNAGICYIITTLYADRDFTGAYPAPTTNRDNIGKDG